MKNYLVIGGSSGIGKEIAKELSKNGNQVYASYHKNIQESDQNLQYFYLDVLEPQQDLSFLPESINGFIYCPGAILLKPFARISTEDFIQDYQLQVIGAIKTIQQVLPRLKNAASASIVLFSTVAVHTGFNFHSVVAASKGAIEGLTKALAAELAPKIRVNCIAPSITNTQLASSLLNTDEKIAANAQRHPLKRIGTPKEIAGLACFILGEQSSWITGQIIHVDGGMSSIKL
jgi:NAD(P)-dependent dehydrogenase (short-subunit alcohol dehydrogenase family)